jgi:SAM-dependent methyltransferase
VSPLRHNGPTVDFGRAAQDYATHRSGFPDELYDRLANHGIGLAGQRVLDLGTGTGTLARGLARRGCRVTGLDPSRALLEEARRLDGAAGVAVGHLLGRAERTGLASSAFDVVTAGQCWHWFDRPLAAREILRVLEPGGRLVIAHFDWLGGVGTVVDRTQKLIRRFNPSWHTLSSTGLYPRWLHDLTGAGFTGVETFSFDVVVPYTHERWRGRLRASAGVAASLPADEVARFDQALAAELLAHFPAEPLPIPHRVWAVLGTSPTGG